MTRTKITRIILIKAREFQDLDYYMRQMIIDGHIKMLFPCTVVLLLFILKKTGAISLESFAQLPDSFAYFFILGIPYLIYRIHVNRKIIYKFPNLELYSDDELLLLVRNLNRQRKMFKHFVNTRAPWKFLWSETIFIVAACVGLVYQYHQKKIQNASELGVVLSILIAFSIASRLIMKRDAQKFDELQKQGYIKAKNVIFDSLILSNLNPYNHATTRPDKRNH